MVNLLFAKSLKYLSYYINQRNANILSLVPKIDPQLVFFLNMKKNDDDDDAL